MRAVKSQISLGTWFLHADNEDSDQPGQIPRLIRVFAGRTGHCVVLSCCGSFQCMNPRGRKIVADKKEHYSPHLIAVCSRPKCKPLGLTVVPYS